MIREIFHPSLITSHIIHGQNKTVIIFFRVPRTALRLCLFGKGLSSPFLGTEDGCRNQKLGTVVKDIIQDDIPCPVTADTEKGAA